ncbi:MAG TPA: ATP-binding protein [Blastocatellia bacterium]|nr:ATP-binding protein [Blastocatellia bacterium]
MTNVEHDKALDEAVLILAPVGRDAEITGKALNEANLNTHPCADMEELCDYMLKGAGAALITVESLTVPAVECLINAIGQQPAWSDFPLIILTSSGGKRPKEASPLETLSRIANAMMIERPTGIFTLISATQAALRARRRQYEIRDQLIKRQELEESLKQRAAELSEANRLKDEFLATVSHELRTPLSAILGWTALLRRGRLQGEKAAEALEIIERNAKSQSQLINDLLDVSRIITGKLRLDQKPVDFNSAIFAALETVRPAAEAKEIKLDVNLDAEGALVKGDQNRLQQIVWNLLSNAIKFTPKGGKVSLSSERTDSQIKFTVKDTGVGINLDFLPFVFDRFTQADGTSTRSHGGLGLGLAIVRHLVELHGGRVMAHSEGPGKGAEFTVLLPIMAVESETINQNNATVRDSAPETEESYDLTGVRVLVVDDLKDARELIGIVLESQGAQVETVSSVADALRVIKSSPPDVLVSDIGMPDEDGYSLIRKVRQLDDNYAAQVPAIAVTAYAGEKDRKQLLRAGYQAHLSKPVEPSELVATVGSFAHKFKMVSHK